METPNHVPRDPDPKSDLPTLTLVWDQEKQGVGITFDTAKIKTWDFVLAMLQMAVEKARVNMQMQIGHEMQQKAAEQYAAQQLHQKLRGGR